VIGTYLPGCFASDGFRAAFLQSLGAEASALRFEDRVERTLDALAFHLETHLDLDGLLALAEPV
jgi:adenosylcobyric acid synthase